MNIWNKVLVGLLVPLALLFFYLGIKTLGIHRQWRDQANRLERELEDAERQSHELEFAEGEPGKDAGIRQARQSLYKLTVNRGRTWENARPVEVQPAQSPVRVRVVLDKPLPGIRSQMHLFVFDQRKDEPAWRYLAELTVAQVATNGTEFWAQTTRKLNDRELKRLQDSQAGQAVWKMYEVMPADSPAIFAGIDEKQLRQMLPEPLVAEYLKDPAKRMPRDYELLFREYHRQRSMLTDRIAGLTQDQQYMTESLADAKVQEQFRRNMIQALETELAAAQRELKAVDDHRQALAAELAKTEAAVQATLASNRAAVGEIARIQGEATRRADERSRSLAAQ